MSNTMQLQPRMTEKAYSTANKLNCYIFDVPRNANKISVTKAVESQFKVSVVSVNINNVKGKAKQAYRRTGGSIKGFQNNVKRAYVTLKAGDKLPLFASVEESEAKEKKTQKIVEKSAKKIGKDKK